MAYPAATKTLQTWVQDVDSIAVRLKVAAQEQRTLSLASTLNIDHIRRFFDVLVQANVFFIAAAAVTGIAAYLTSQKQNQVADPVAEFTAMRNAVVGTLDWLRANVPQSNSGGTDYKLGFAFPTGNITASSPITFTAAQTATYRTQLDTLIATIS